MTLLNTDLLVMNRGATNYKVAFGDLTTTMQATDLFMIQRGGTLY